MDKTPKNCRECPHSQNCRSYYGGSTCKYGDEINRAIVGRFLAEQKEDAKT